LKILAKNLQHGLRSVTAAGEGAGSRPRRGTVVSHSPGVPAAG
jgi:hypothetical protein